VVVARVISLANQKGGVGKTTTTINLGAALAEHEKRVLLVDFDPQGALSVGMGINPLSLDFTVYNVLLDRTLEPASAIMKTATPGVDLLPSNIDLSAAEVVLVSEVAREQALKRALSSIKHDYDYVLIDCQPSLGLLTVNALTASDTVIIPLECEYFALRGMALLLDTLDKVRDRLNPELELQGIVLTLFDGRTLHAKEVLERVKEAFGPKLFRTVIPKTIRFAEAPVAGEPILTYASDSKGSGAYRDLAKEVLGIVDDQTSELAGSGRAVQEHDVGDGGAADITIDLPSTEPVNESTDRQSSTEIYRQRDEATRADAGQRADEARGEGDVLLHP
jgi:chromosome partitioning protein